jgi:chromosome condensin MukBEF MukE localization factor
LCALPRCCFSWLRDFRRETPDDNFTAMTNFVGVSDRQVEYQTRASVFRVGAKLAKDDDVAAALAKIAEGYEALAESAMLRRHAEVSAVAELNVA